MEKHIKFINIIKWTALSFGIIGGCLLIFFVTLDAFIARYSKINAIIKQQPLPLEEPKTVVVEKIVEVPVSAQAETQIVSPIKGFAPEVIVAQQQLPKGTEKKKDKSTDPFRVFFVCLGTILFMYLLFGILS